MTYGKNGNGRLWWIAGGLALFMFGAGTSAVSFAIASTKQMTANTTKIVALEEKLNSIDEKLNILLERSK
ncbi:MAG: hypothetical protein V3S68_09060 [Dehalococcoidia bacterium]